jgi:phosphoribosylamine--glycine ligase
MARSPLLERLLIVPGNTGTARHGQNVPLPVQNAESLLRVAQQERIDLLVVGPDNPLADGIVDHFQAAGIAAFGPTAAAAQIESSKSFAKQLMQAVGVPTAEAHVFDDAEQAAGFASSSGRPWVVKADGLALGKGVVVADDVAGTVAAVKKLAATPAGKRLLLEERMSGPEVSVIALCDGKTLLPLPPARDYKRLLDGNQGPNTGGMGAIAPAPGVDEATLQTIVSRCMQPVVDALAARGTPFVGALFAGIMLTSDGPRVLEFNARFGDPETQVLLPLVEGDFLAALLACAEGRLQPTMLRWRKGTAVCVVLAAPGYPDSARLNAPISGVEALEENDNLMIFHAGTAITDVGMATAGGRVMGVVGVAGSAPTARQRAYDAIPQIRFEDKHFRTDIGT